MSGMASTREVASFFGRDTETIRRWCEEGRFEGAERPVGGQWRIPWDSVHAVRAKMRESVMPKRRSTG